MRQDSAVFQNKILRLRQAARQAFEDQRFDESFETLERARRTVPANPALLIEIGVCYLRRYEHAKAAEYFNRAIKFSSRKTAALEETGDWCRLASSFQLARQYLEQAAAQPDVSAEGLATLGWVYERLRRMDEASAVAERALKLNPNSTAAGLISARLDFLGGRLGEAEMRLRALSNCGGDPSVRVRAAYDLGTVLDKQGKYDEAMTAFLHAKSMQSPQTAPLVAKRQFLRARTQAMVESLTSEILQRWFETRSAFQPPIRLALLGGHPRSGTTLLEQVVDSHAGIVSADESDCFNDDAYAPLIMNMPRPMTQLEQLEFATPDAIQNSRSNYVRRMEVFLGEPIGQRLLVDKNPSATLHVPVLARIFPEVKFLIALRDPRDVCMSCFMQSVYLNLTSSAWLSLEGAVGEYIALMGGWRQTAPKLPNPVLEVRYEDMVENLEPVARQTLDFLGVNWDPKVLGFDEHARQKAVRSPTYSDVTKKVFKTAVGRWRNYHKFFEPHLAKLEPLVRALGYE